MNAFPDEWAPSPLPADSYLEHTLDVLDRWIEWQAEGGAALVVVARIQGGGVRAPGALMAVSASSERAGYISGGCIDADVVLHARKALESGEAAWLRYGAGSPFIDLPLPCGGMIEVLILPRPDAALVAACHGTLAARQPALLCFSPDGRIVGPETADPRLSFRYEPKLRLRIAGRGADCLALARLALASGIDARLFLRDDADMEEARRLRFTAIEPLKTPSSLPDPEDDAATAFLVSFHDSDWETALLKQALAGPAFYIGAVGSRRTHEARCACLVAAGVDPADVERTRGPVGLVPSMRDASLLAVSILAEIVDAYARRLKERFSRTALILLAAGEATRFGSDKLLAPLGGQPLLAHSASLLASENVGMRLAVVGPEQDERARLLDAAGWSVIVNETSKAGLSSSLAVGIAGAAGNAEVDAALVLLGDMPRVPEFHLGALRHALNPNLSAVFSLDGETRLPPAIFARRSFATLLSTRGDEGAKSMFGRIGHVAAVPLPAGASIDVDTVEDFETLNAYEAWS